MLGERVAEYGEDESPLFDVWLVVVFTAIEGRDISCSVGELARGDGLVAVEAEEGSILFTFIL